MPANAGYWYFGEETKEFADGKVGTAGSFEAGVDGALQFAFLIHSQQRLGAPYGQRFRITRLC